MSRTRVFISYRRDDSAGHAGRLFDRLAERFGAQCVFRDVDTLSAGEDFHAALRPRIQDADLLLALIGPGWLRATDAGGHARLGDAADPVRMEIAGALRRDQRMRALRALLDRGVALEDRLQSMQEWRPTALLLAIENRLPDAALLLVARGADVDAATGFTGSEQPDMSALMWAAHTGQVELVSALLDQGACIDAQNRDGCNALMIAADSGQVEVPQLLLQRGADAALRNRNGQDALARARAAGHEQAVRVLAPLTPGRWLPGRSVMPSAAPTS
jgi:hypothetical protein